MTEEGLKLSEVIKLCEDGAYIKGDYFRSQYGQSIFFHGDYFDFGDYRFPKGSVFEYKGNVYEVNE